MKPQVAWAVVLTLLNLAGVGVMITAEENRHRDSVRLEYEIRALLREEVLPPSDDQSLAVRPADLADGFDLYVGRRVLVPLRAWKVQGDALLWFRYASDPLATVEVRLAAGEPVPEPGRVWIAGTCAGQEGHRVLISDGKVVRHGKGKE